MHIDSSFHHCVMKYQASDENFPVEDALSKEASLTKATVSSTNPRAKSHVASYEGAAMSEDYSPTKTTLSTTCRTFHQATYEKPLEEDALSGADARTKVTVASTGTMSLDQARHENPREMDLENSPTKDFGSETKFSSLPSLNSLEDGHFVDDDDVDQRTVMQRHYLNGKLRVISNVVFIVASALYVAAEATYLPYYQFYRDVPYDVREAVTDDVWWTYYNETDAYPDYLSNATDDYSWSEWYNNSFLDEKEVGEFLFPVPNADRKYEVRCTRFQN
jgi:hypothetical protein